MNTSRDQLDFVCAPVSDREFDPGDEVMLVCPCGQYETEGPYKVLAVVSIFQDVIYVVATTAGARETSGVEMVALADHQERFRRTSN
jgi:hypothetical protein